MISNELILAMRKSFMSLSLAYKYKEEEATRKLRQKKGGGGGGAVPAVADRGSALQDDRTLHQKVEEEVTKIEDKALQDLELDLDQHQNRSFFVSKRVIIKEWIRVRPDNDSTPNTNKRGDDLPSGISFNKSPSPTNQGERISIGLDKSDRADFTLSLLKNKDEETKDGDDQVSVKLSSG